MKNVFADNISKRKLAPEFERIFGVPLDRYFDNILGFDIVAFDDNVVKPQDYESMEEAVIRKYSQEAADLIWKLLE